MNSYAGALRLRLHSNLLRLASAKKETTGPFMGRVNATASIGTKQDFVVLKGGISV